EEKRADKLREIFVHMYSGLCGLSLFGFWFRNLPQKGRGNSTSFHVGWVTEAGTTRPRAFRNPLKIKRQRQCWRLEANKTRHPFKHNLFDCLIQPSPGIPPA